MISGSIMDGQRHLFEHHIYHSDIKEANVLLDVENGSAKAAVLSDFGVSSFKGYNNLGSTPCFEAPELLSGPNRKPDELSEIWSTGLLILKIALHPPRNVWADDVDGERPLLAMYPKSLGSLQSEPLKNLITSMLYPDRNLRCDMKSAIQMFNALSVADFGSSRKPN